MFFNELHLLNQYIKVMNCSIAESLAPALLQSLYPIIQTSGARTSSQLINFVARELANIPASKLGNHSIALTWKLNYPMNRAIPPSRRVQRVQSQQSGNV